MAVRRQSRTFHKTMWILRKDSWLALGLLVARLQQRKKRFAFELCRDLGESEGHTG